MKITTTDAILAIKNDAQVSVSGEGKIVEWHDGNPTKITYQQILDKKKELQAIEDIYENRRKEYGSIVFQLDEIYHNGIDAWKTRIASIKNKYPK